MGWQEDDIVQGWEQDEVVQAPPPPTDLEVASNAASKGVAGFIDMFPNAPINAWNLSKAVTGYTAEKLGFPEILANTTMTPTPDPARKLLTAIGAIKEEHEPQTSGQRILDLAVQSGAAMIANPVRAVGLLPKAWESFKNIGQGITAGTAGGMTKEATDSDVAATAASVVAPIVTKSPFIARANAPLLANPVRATTLRDALDAGYVVPPSTVKPSFVTNRIESIAGKAATKQEAALRNQQVTNRLAAEEIGLPGDTALTEGVLKQVRDEAGTVYQDIAAISPRASSALENLKQARFDAKEQWNYYGRSGDPEAGKLARSLSAKAEMYERVIEREAKQIIKVYGVKPVTPSTSREVGFAVPATKAQLQSSTTLNAEQIGEIMAGRQNILQELRDARTRIAKTYDIEKALNLGSGDVDAHVIGRLLDKGGIASKSGNLLVIGKFAQAFRDASREGSRVPAAGVSAMDASMALGLGTAGYLGTENVYGTALAALPLIRGPVRYGLLSGMYQKKLLKEPPTLNQALLQSVMAGRPVAEESKER